MKKKFILFLIVIISIIVFINLNSFSIDNILSIEISANAQISEVSSKNFTHFIKLIKESDKTKKDISNKNDPYFYADYILKNKTIKYKFFFNLSDKTIYYKKDGKLYLVNKENSSYFYLNNFFEYVYYPNFKELDLFFNDSRLDYESIYKKLYFKKINNKKYNTEINKENTNLTINNISKSSNLIIKSIYTNIKLIVKDEKNNIIYSDVIKNKNKVFIPDLDGIYSYEIIYKSAENKSSITKKYKISVDNPIKIVLENNFIKQGNFITLKVINKNKKEKIEIDNPFYKNFKLYYKNNYEIGYIPINSRVKPGEYFINYTINNNKSKKLKVTILKRDFRIQKLYVTKKIMNTTSNSKAYEEYHKYFNESHKISSYDDKIEEKFIWPLNGKVTTEFGERRSINDIKTSYSHSGVDIAAPRGTNVKATNNGQVTLSMGLALTGNTIVIDHGKGLFSYYLHLDERNVKKGEYIKQNDIIGKVGSTGRSTGSHLHFGISFYGQYVDPGFLVFNEAITKSNYNNLINDN